MDESKRLSAKTGFSLERWATRISLVSNTNQFAESSSHQTGMQGGNVSAMVKHFAAFGNPEQGLNVGPTHGGERELRTTYLPSYKRQIIDAGVYAIMSSYSDYDGVALVANHHVLTDILRDEWGYKYWVTSDAGGTDRLCNAFKMCKEKPIDKEAVTLYALPAGNDVEMGGGSYNFATIPKLVKDGKLSVDIVDTAVSRLLRAKFAMGLFENPYTAVPANKTASKIHTKENIALARELDAESIILLENHNNVLPLSEKAKVAVIGPMAHGYMNVSYMETLSGIANFSVRGLRGEWQSISGRDSTGRNQGCKQRG